ncbi:MAG: pyridoxal phosphate-dependent aminotransferase [Christensenellales bacterium]|jgi:aspartate aminotransferase
MPLDLSRTCLGISPSATLAIDTKAKALAAAGNDVIQFGVGEPDSDTPAFICDAAKAAIDAGMTRYTPVAGTLELRREIAKKFERDNALTYDPAGEVFVSTGAKQVIFVALCAMLNPGDEVIIPAPFWVSYPEMVRMAGGVPVFAPTRADRHFVFDAGDIAPYVTPRTKAIILNSPSNPCGSVLPRASLEGIAKLAVARGFYVISDEIYESLVYDGAQHHSIAALGADIFAQTVVVNGVSKTYAMTGWRIGYAAGPRAIIAAMTAYQSHSTSNPNSIAQAAATAALADGNGACVREMVAAFDRRRKLIHRLVNDVPGLSAQLPAGAFYLMVNIGALIGKKYQGEVIGGSDRFAELLLEHEHVAVVPGKAFGDDAHVRLSYATSDEKIARGIARMAAFTQKLTD